MTQVFFSLGSNLGDREASIEGALNAIEEHIGRITSISPIYTTAPVGFAADTDFLNLCIEVETSLSAYEILDQTNAIETTLGRAAKSTTSYESRVIDIDIIFFGSSVLSTENLIIPHPHFRLRKFVLKPLNDIAGNWIDPVTHLTIEQLLANCTDTSEVVVHRN